MTPKPNPTTTLSTVLLFLSIATAGVGLVSAIWIAASAYQAQRDELQRLRDDVQQLQDYTGTPDVHPLSHSKEKR